MEPTTKPALMMYTEQTPNPESLKYVTNRMIYSGTADFRTPDLAGEWSPLAQALFSLPYVKGVYISNNFVTITKELTFQWEDIMLPLKGFIKEYLEGDGGIVTEGYAEAMAEIEVQQGGAENYDEADKAIVQKIIELINTYVKPAVEMDGGNIEFKAFREGTVVVSLQGSCSGCPSSTVTLKSGIEGMLKRMVPEVPASRGSARFARHKISLRL
jgi:NFU1 iron-sulfur cluster scaffold homolog, mitochondrial